MSDLTQANSAREWLGCAENVRGDSLDAAQEGTLNALLGIGFALLDVADAIREQTAALDLGSVRADLDDISSAMRRGAS